jgi:hypothetical protein
MKTYSRRTGSGWMSKALKHKKPPQETDMNPTKTKLKAKPPEQAKPGKTKALIFGASGVGKTWFTLDFPAPYYIDTEGGARQKHYRDKLTASGGAYMGPDEGALDFQTVIDQMEALATEKHEFKTLVIDSITKLFQVTIANEAQRLGDKDAFGASKKPAVAYMRRLVNWAMRLDMNIWFVAHEGTEWGINPKTGQREEIGKVPDVWDKLVYELDLALHAKKIANNRLAVVRKSRLIGFPDLESFPLEFDDFAARFGKDAIEAPVALITLATPEQVAEITRLLTVLNISETDKEKVLTKAGADNWNELTTEQATATIDWLKKKLN